MRLENLNKEFPRTPDNIRTIIEQEVMQQMNHKPDFPAGRDSEITQKEKYPTTTKRLSLKKTAVIALAATMVLGTSVFAGTTLYRIYTEKEGTYGVKTGFTADPETSAAVNTSTTQAENTDSYGNAPSSLPIVSIQNNYIPQGMVAADDNSPGKMYYEETPYRGGISMVLIAMDDDMSKASLQVLDTNVTFSEELTISGHDAVYLEKESEYNKIFYVAYPEVWHILQVYAGKDTTKEEVIKVIENTELVPTGEECSFADAYTWSDFASPVEEYDADFESSLTASAEELENTHRIGEAFALNTFADTETEEFVDTNVITAKVTDVQISDDLSTIQNSEYLDESITDAVGSDGKLLPNTISYIKSGDGVDTLDEVLKTEHISQKLVNVTVEYTNTGDVPLKNILFMGFFTGLQEEEGAFTIYDRAKLKQEGDEVSYAGPGSFGEMQFYDVHGGERSNNYIPSLNPGETISIQMARIINEDELPYMYLDLCSSGSSYEISEESLKQGYVDIRQ